MFGEAIEKVEDFIYLGSWIESTDREIRVRKGKAWGALHRLKDIWKSKLSKSLKIRLFIAACESVYPNSAVSFGAEIRIT